MMKKHAVPLSLARAVALVPIATLLSVGCGESGPDIVPPDQPPQTRASFVRAFGNFQTGTVGERLPRPVGVSVTDDNGDPVAGLSVRFTPADANGSAEPAQTTTDENGVARSNWILGTVAGSDHLLNVVLVGSGLDSIRFSATAKPGVAVLLTLLGGDGQTGQPGGSLVSLIRVKVTDAFGNGVPRQLVKFSPATSNGAMTPEDMPADANGLASARWTLGDFTGVQRASVWSPGLTGSPARITATAQ